MGGANIGHHSVLELTDFSLECVASVEEHDVVAAFADLADAIGVGEQIDDLDAFDPGEFARALVGL